MHVGKAAAQPPCDIIFGGRDMSINHADIIKENDSVYIRPFNQKCLLYINGKRIREKTQLKTLDRIIFGWNSVYVFYNPKDKN